jgi:aminopeptidase N
LAGACRTALEAAPPNSGLQLTAARALIRCADDADAGWLRSWLDDSTAAPEGLAIDAELRWSLLASLAAYGCVDDGDIEAEYQRDRTGTSLAQAAGCRALLPDADAKAAAWSRLVDDSTASSKVLFAIANAFWHPDHASLTAPYVIRYVTDMPPMARRRPSQLAERVAERGFPHTAVSAETLGLMTALAERDDLTTALRRALANATDDLRRSLAARAAAR